MALPRTTLISFLGRGPYSHDGSRGSYWETRYRFSDLGAGPADWTSEGATYFADAICRYRTSQGEPPFSRIVILGTAGSMWDALADTWGGDRENAGLVADFALENLCERVDRQSVDERVLAEYAALFNAEAGEDRYQFLMIPSAADPGTQAAILERILPAVEEGSRVWLDVTHGFRHLPMLGLAAAAIAAQVKHATVEHILYGALDMRQEGITPVISLNWILRLFHALTAIDEFTRYQRIRPIIDCFPGGALRADLENAAFRLDVMRIEEGASAVGKARNALKAADLSSTPELQVLRRPLLDRLSQFAKRKRDIPGLTSMAELALQEEDYLRAAIFVYEAVQMAQEVDLPGDGHEDGQLIGLRNALAHAGKFTLGSQNLVRNRGTVEGFLQGQIKRLRKEAENG